MYYYAPPKASLWGHRLRKLSAAEAHERLARFLGVAADSYHFGWYRVGTTECGALASLWLLSDDATQLALLEELLGERAQFNGFGKLDQRQFERCLAHLITLEHSAPSTAGSMLLKQPLEILAWRIAGRSIPTLSRLSMGYGHTRCLSTYLEFETVEDFHSIAAVFAECGLCKLNEKHLKKDRSRQA